MSDPVVPTNAGTLAALLREYMPLDAEERERGLTKRKGMWVNIDHLAAFLARKLAARGVHVGESPLTVTSPDATASGGSHSSAPSVGESETRPYLTALATAGLALYDAWETHDPGAMGETFANKREGELLSSFQSWCLTEVPDILRAVLHEATGARPTHEQFGASPTPREPT